MATDASFVDYVLEQAGLGARIATRRMFGEYAVYVDGKVVALACDNTLFLKRTDASEALLAGTDQGPPYPGAKPHWRLDAVLDDRELLPRVLQLTADALPLPKPKPPAKARARQARPQGR
jgi:TfoX/Sxy family transcriptional regulator of competence genes